MKKTHLLFISIIVMIAMLAGCGRQTAPAAPAEVPEEVEGSASAEVSEAAEETTPVEVSEATEAAAPVEEPEEAASVEEPAETEEAAPAEISEDAKAPAAKDPASDSSGDATPDTLRTIVWLGDSLTQGSLGEDNDNLPNAPYVKLQSMIPNKVEGYGLYGYNTHDIFWVYKDEDHYDQTVDPNKIYIFWVGSNDWCPIDGENTNTAPVIAEIDSFLQSGGVKDYIVMGTTQRWRLGLDRAKIINADLAAHYGNHYMDVIDLIEKNGFSEDNTHLSQASYDAIAGAVCAKLKALGYI